MTALLFPWERHFAMMSTAWGISTDSKFAWYWTSLLEACPVPSSSGSLLLVKRLFRSCLKNDNAINKNNFKVAFNIQAMVVSAFEIRPWLPFTFYYMINSQQLAGLASVVKMIVFSSG